MAQEGELLERVRVLEARLAAVEAVQEIHNLKARYAELVDARYGKDGPRPPFNFPGAWLYAGNQPVVHVVAGRPFSADTGTGGVDHVAFMAKGDPDAMMKRLEGEGLKPSSRIVPATKIRQVFCRDPSGVQVELNYPMT